MHSERPWGRPPPSPARGSERKKREAPDSPIFGLSGYSGTTYSVCLDHARNPARICNVCSDHESNLDRIYSVCSDHEQSGQNL